MVYGSIFIRNDASMHLSAISPKKGPSLGIMDKCEREKYTMGSQYETI